MTASSPSRGLLYPTVPEYDVFESQSETAPGDSGTAAESDVDESRPSAELGESPVKPGEPPAEPDETTAPIMARANWTGSIPAGD
jgi:hypothetical protein